MVDIRLKAVILNGKAKETDYDASRSTYDIVLNTGSIRVWDVLVKVVNFNIQNVQVPYFYTFIGCTHIITCTFFAFQYTSYIALMMILAFHYHEVNKPSGYWISISFVNKEPFPRLVGPLVFCIWILQVEEVRYLVWQILELILLHRLFEDTVSTDGVLSHWCKCIYRRNACVFVGACLSVCHSSRL